MKKNVAKKILAGALASTMVLSMAACGEGEQQSSTPGSSTPASSTPASSTPASSSAAAEPTPEPGPDMTPLSITVAIPSLDGDHNAPNEWYDKLVAELNEYLQMDITWQWGGDQDSYYERLALDIIAGDVADVMLVGKDATFLTAAEEGLFWDLAPYLDDYDNLATIPQATRENAAHNGKIYGIPRSRTLARNGLGYRLDWLNNLGLKEPTTWEDFYNMLYAFTYNDPDGNGVDDTVGLFLDSWGGVWDLMFVWFGVPNQWGIDANGDLIYKCMTPEYKEAAAAIRTLYADGLINNGSNGIPDFREVGAGKARNEGWRTQMGGCGIQVLDELRKVQTYFQDQGITTEDNIIFTLQGAVDTGRGTLCFPTTGMNNMIAISTKTIKTEDQLRRVLQMINDINDGEVLNLIEYGWEGLTYSIDENGYVYDFNEEELAASGVGSKGYSTGFNQILPYFTAEENARPVTRPAASTPITILENELYEENIQYCVTNYGASYTSDFYVMQGAAMDAILADALVKYITGEIDDAGFDEQIKTWWTAGGEQVTKEMNEKYHAAGN